MNFGKTYRNNALQYNSQVSVLTTKCEAHHIVNNLIQDDNAYNQYSERCKSFCQNNFIGTTYSNLINSKLNYNPSELPDYRKHVQSVDGYSLYRSIRTQP